MEAGSPKVLYLGDFAVRSSWELGPRYLDEYELVYFPDGNGTIYQSGDVIYQLDQPSWVITRPGVVHRYHFSKTSATRHLFIHFHGGEAHAPKLLHSDGPHVIPTTNDAFPAILITQLLLTAHTYPDAAKRIEALFIALLSEVEGTLTDTFPLRSNETGPAESAAAAYPAIVRDALSYIHRHLNEHISISDIACHCKISQEHLTRTFTRVLGIPPIQEMIRLRLERAAHMLRHSAHSIKEIAGFIGFSDEHYFSRTFAAKYGLTATAYRARHSDPRVQHLAPEASYQARYPMNVMILLNGGIA